MSERSLWTKHIAAGVVVLVLLGLHMTIMHLNATLGLFGGSGADPVEWDSVVSRMQGAFFTVTYVVLLLAALYHGFFGLRNILLELNPGPAVRRTINWGLSVVGAALFVFGAWAAIVAPSAIGMGG